MSTPGNSRRWPIAVALLAVALSLSLGAGSAQAQFRFPVPAVSPGVPAYARVERPFVFHTDEWAAIVFYRDPTCIPPAFNLLDFFDFPAAFDCSLTVSGFEIWEDLPGVALAPRQSIFRGTAVPVWFVPWSTLQAAIADDVLTLPELESLNPLEGIATIFREVLQPLGGAQMPHLTISASGILTDGRTFQYEFTAVSSGLVRARINFR